MKPRVKSLCLTTKTMDPCFSETVVRKCTPFDALLADHFFRIAFESADDESNRIMSKTDEISANGV